MNYTISCIIKNQRGECLTDNGWHNDCNLAVLFAPQQAEATIMALAEKPTPVTVSALYVIQNERFDYHDGKKPWVYRIADATFYLTLQEAEAEVKALSR
jgi:hypothetical protein